MIAKIIARGADRDEALAALAGALTVTRVDGVATNLGLLRAVAARPDVRAVAHSTSTLDGVTDPEPRIDVLEPGALTTVQDWPGRLGYWQVGVPPSGPMDEVSLREANLAVGNPEGAAALEITATGPTLRFSARHAHLPGRRGVGRGAEWCGTQRGGGPVVDAGDRAPRAPSWRSARSPGLACAPTSPWAAASTCRSTWAARRRSPWAGSAATAAAPCRQGTCCARAPRRRSASRPSTPAGRRPALVSDWEIGVTEGPHAAPDFFTRADIDELYTCVYTVHHNSARTGVRLIGPRPSWAREDGGEAGLHPSNIHDCPTPSARSTSPATPRSSSARTGRAWAGSSAPPSSPAASCGRSGQLRPGDTVRFVAVTRSRRGRAAATAARSPTLTAHRAATATTASWPGARRARTRPPWSTGATATTTSSSSTAPRSSTWACGCGCTRCRRPLRPRASTASSTSRPGIRSLQVHTDAGTAAARESLLAAAAADRGRAAAERASCASRPGPCGCRCPGTTRRPGWRSSGTCTACAPTRRGRPWNIEFIRRINGLESVDGRAPTSCSTRSTWCSASATCTSARPSPPRSTHGIGW